MKKKIDSKAITRLKAKAKVLRDADNSLSVLESQNQIAGTLGFDSWALLVKNYRACAVKPSVTAAPQQQEPPLIEATPPAMPLQGPRARVFNLPGWQIRALESSPGPSESNFFLRQRAQTVETLADIAKSFLTAAGYPEMKGPFASEEALRNVLATLPPATLGLQWNLDSLGAQDKAMAERQRAREWLASSEGQEQRKLFGPPWTYSA